MGRANCHLCFVKAFRSIQALEFKVSPFVGVSRFRGCRAWIGFETELLKVICGAWVTGHDPMDWGEAGRMEPL